MDKLSHTQVGQMLKEAAVAMRAISEEREQLRAKVAHYEKKEWAEKIAAKMEEKNLQPDLSFEDKVRGLLSRDDLNVVEEAVGLSAPQMKLASVDDPYFVTTTSGDGEGAAEQAFVSVLLSDQ